MSGKWVFRFGLGVVGTVVLASTYVIAQQKPAGPPPPMTFFVTSVGSGDGANLGGLAGADALCQKLATGVGAGARTWRAYLSTSAQGNQPAVNARDRIGPGPVAQRQGPDRGPRSGAPPRRHARPGARWATSSTG